MKKLVLVPLACLLIAGCSTTQKIYSNINEDLNLLADRVHIDTQQVILHPERWPKAVDYLCDEVHYFPAKQCLDLKVIMRVRQILVEGQ